MIIICWSILICNSGIDYNGNLKHDNTTFGCNSLILTPAVEFHVKWRRRFTEVPGPSTSVLFQSMWVSFQTIQICSVFDKMFIQISRKVSYVICLVQSHLIVIRQGYRFGAETRYDYLSVQSRGFESMKGLEIKRRRLSINDHITLFLTQQLFEICAAFINWKKSDTLK